MLMKMLKVRLQKKITKTGMRQLIQASTNTKEITVERKLKLFGHVCCMEPNRTVTKDGDVG